MPRRIAHLLNGDAFRPRFEAWLEGLEDAQDHIVQVWHDALIDGPVAPALVELEAQRARGNWMQSIYGVEATRYLEGLRADLAWLEARAHDDALEELVLWFEADHFCEVNLLFICAHLADARFAQLELSLVLARGPGGTADPDFNLSEGHGTRLQVDGATRAAAAEAWRAYADADAKRFSATPLPDFLPHFHRNWRERFCDETGMDALEHSTLEALSEPRNAGRLFGLVCGLQDAPHKDHGLGDLQYWRILHGLRDARLIEFDGALLPLDADFNSPTDPRELEIRATGNARPAAESPYREVPIGGADRRKWTRDQLA